MKVVIIEDEPLAAEKLERYLLKYGKTIEVHGTLTSIEVAVPWIEEHQLEVDLIFMDVQLTDGLSFEIFSQTQVKKPVIFTTAFDEFAIDAFKVNSIDYLLKPITFTDLSQALKKFESFKAQFSGTMDIGPIAQQLGKKVFKDRFLVRIGNHIHSVLTDAIGYFYAEGRDVYLCHINGRRYLIEYTLEALEEVLDPRQYLRVNRSYIVHINSIEDTMVFANRRLKLTLAPKTEKELIVSREKVAQFKLWLEGQ